MDTRLFSDWLHIFGGIEVHRLLIERIKLSRQNLEHVAFNLGKKVKLEKEFAEYVGNQLDLFQKEIQYMIDIAEDVALDGEGPGAF